jgi:hypothetical protein
MNEYFVPKKEYARLVLLKYDGPLIPYYHRPLYQQAFNWILKNHGLICMVVFIDDETHWTYRIFGRDVMSPFYEFTLEIEEFSSQEEAQLGCLRKMLDILEQE